MFQRMQRVLVAGATGYVGRHAVLRYAGAGYDVMGLTRTPGRLDREGPFATPAVGQHCTEVVARVTEPETLRGICDGVDVVFSSVGISRQRDRLSFEQVDHLANRALLEEAQRAGVEKFVYVSLWGPEEIPHLEIVQAHERFVADLEASGIDHVVIRPSGYFSDMGSVLSMARRGLVLIVGDGTNRMNPIHGDDVARVAVEATDGDERSVGCGGPDVFTQLELAELCGDIWGRRVRTLKLSQRMLAPVHKTIGRIDRQFGDLAEFLVTAGVVDAVAPTRGVHRLEDHLRGLARRAREN